MARKRPQLAKRGIICSDKEVKSHLVDLGRQLGADLPQREAIIFAPRLLVSGNLAYSIQASAATKQAENSRGFESVVESTRTGTGKILYVGVTEEWRRAADRFEFGEVRVRFYIVGRSDAAIGPPVARLEWEGINANASFNGRGAGHPHWQFGAEERAEDDESSREAADSIAAELVSAQVDSNAQLDPPMTDSIAENSATPSTSGRSTSKRFHYPAKASWALTAWDPQDDPQGARCHASNPLEVSELVNWVVSANRYMANELKKYG